MASKLIAKDRNSLSSDSLVQLAADEVENKKILAESTKKRDEFLKKEKSIFDEIYELQTNCCMNPLGRDRYYRRYWMYKSLPGVFVEDDDYDFKLGCYSTSTAENEIKTEPSTVSSAFSDLVTSSYTAYYTENTTDIKPVEYVRADTKWGFYFTVEQLDALIANLNERGLRESELKQNLLSFKVEKFDRF